LQIDKEIELPILNGTNRRSWLLSTRAGTILPITAAIVASLLSMQHAWSQALRPSAPMLVAIDGNPVEAGTHHFTGLPLTQEGWHDFDTILSRSQYANSRFVFVDPDGSGGQVYTQTQVQALGGSITNPSAAPNAYRTLSSAYAQMRDGQADVMLLRRGKTFSETLAIAKNGTSASALAIYTAYGPESANRPNARVYASGGDFLFLSSMFFDLGSSSFQVTHNGDKVYLEDMGYNAAFGTPGDILFYHMAGGGMVRRSTFARVPTYSGDTGLRERGLIEESTFSYAPPGTGYSNMYLSESATVIDVIGTQSMMSQRMNFRNRVGGVYRGNLSSGSSSDSRALQYLGGFDLHFAIQMYDNVSMHTWGPDTITSPRNFVAQGNLFVHPKTIQAFRVHGGYGTPPQGNSVISNNIFYQSQSGALIHWDTVDGVLGAGWNITFNNNDFIKSSGGQLFSALNNSSVNWGSGNRFYSSSATSTWFAGGLDFSAMTSGHGSALTSLQGVYPDPSRNMVTYIASLGGNPSDVDQAHAMYLDGFNSYPGAHANRRGAWDSRFTARAVNNYMRAGFGLAPL
jgi:hypothetical protein